MGFLMTGLSGKETFAKLCLVDGCDDGLRAAVERFSLLYEGESSRSISWSPEEALKGIVCRAWESCIEHLSIPFLDEQLAPFRSLNCEDSLHSSEVIRAVDKHLCRFWDRLQSRSTELRRILEAEGQICATDQFEEGSLIRDWFEPEDRLRASIDTLRSVLFQSRILLSPKYLRLRSGVSSVVEEPAPHSGAQPKRSAKLEDSWFHGTLSRSWLSRRFGEPTHVEEDQGFPKFCAFTSRGVPCERLTEYEAYRRGETCDAESWQGLRVLKLDRCAQHPHNARTLPTWGESSSAELAHFVHAQIKFMTTHPKTGPLGGVVSEPHKRTCRLCSRRTELWAALREGKAFSRDLSSNFCRHHRSQQKDGQWERPDGQDLDSSTYESRTTKVKTFLLEFARLHAHAAHRIEPIRTAQSASRLVRKEHDSYHRPR